MEFSSLLDLKGKIGLTRGVSQFTADDESLFMKHDNRLFKISAKSDLGKQSRIFQILRRPKKLQEILKLLSEFKKKDVIDILHTLYKLNLITFETTTNKNTSKGDVFDSSYFLRDHAAERNNKSRFDSRIVLIGNGVLTDMLIESLRRTNIKFKRIKSFPIVHKSSKKMADQIDPGKNKKASETISSSFSSSFTSSFNKSDLIIVAEDYPNIALFESVNELCFKMNKVWIRASFDDNIGYLGPFVVPRKTSCFNCSELRLVTNSPYYEYELWRHKQNIPKTELAIPEFFADILSSICTNEIFRYLTNEKPETIDHLYVFDTRQMNFTKHKVISHPNCIFCNPSTRKKIQSPSFSTRKVTSRRTAIVSLNDTDNSNSLLSEKELLRRLRELIDDKTGIILEYEKLYETPPLGVYFHHFSTATCSKPLRIGLKGQLTKPVRAEDSLISPSPSGSGLSATEAEIHALMESVERYSNMVVDESRFIWSTYNVVEKRAINPKDLGLYSDDQYDRNDLMCSRFSADSEIPWIQGQDLSSGKSVLIPVDFVYYPAVREKPLVFDTSNGASAHTDIVLAILNGLFEVIERDSFLTMWLNKISMPILNIKKLPFGFNESIKLINDFGMNVKLVDLTNDTRVPTVMAVCYNKKPSKYPALLVGTGSHIEPEKAVQKALFEMEFMLIEALENPNKKKITRPDEISTMYEHPLYYLNPKMRKYWEFMISAKQTSELPMLAKSSFKDNYSMLMQVVKLLDSMNHRVIWVDITPSDINRMGLKAVKVFVTGFQPLYVGNKFRLNLERIHSSAERLGYNIKATMVRSELNSAPHPLP